MWSLQNQELQLDIKGPMMFMNIKKGPYSFYFNTDELEMWSSNSSPKKKSNVKPVSFFYTTF